MSRRRSPARGAFLGGLAGSAAWPLLRGLPGALFATAVLLAALWSLAPAYLRALVVLTVVAFLALPLLRRYGRAPRTVARLPRTATPTCRVYVIREWRDRDLRVLHPLAARRRRDAVEHLVYVGKTVDWDQREADHRRDRPWWHNWLAVTLIECGTEERALAAEEALIREAAESPWPNDWPRENEKHNKRWREDRERRERLREVAFAA